MFGVRLFLKMTARFTQVGEKARKFTASRITKPDTGLRFGNIQFGDDAGKVNKLCHPEAEPPVLRVAVGTDLKKTAKQEQDPSLRSGRPLSGVDQPGRCSAQTLLPDGSRR